MADKFIQMAQRNTGNTDWDNLFPLGKFETAGGTATAITLTIPNLVDGVSKTFIASASNNSAATTINGKSLYKPNTTTAPNLIAGKAYTVWYNASSCFFIKASAVGTAGIGDVLAGKTFSNDVDVELVGTATIESLGGYLYYTGNGNFVGYADSSINLSLPFTPKILIIKNNQDNTDISVYIRNVGITNPKIGIITLNGSGSQFNVQSNNSTFTWYAFG